MAQNKEKKACKTALYGKIKKRRHILQNISYLSTVTTQHKSRPKSKALIY